MFVVKATKNITRRTELMHDWSKSEIKLIINDKYVDKNKNLN